MAKSEKERAIDLAVAQIEKEFGKGAIMKLGENQSKMAVASISTGILSLDMAIGIGGVPRGRIIELYGPESSGKTTLSLNVVANAQKEGGIAAFIDAEHALDPVYAKKLGVDTDNLLIAQPDDGEQAMDIAETLIRSGAIDVIVVDSVAALVPRTEIQGDMDQTQVGMQARLMSKALRKLTATVAKSKTCLIFINQLREKVGIIYGNPEVTPGGRALKFYASVRMEIRRISSIKKGEDILGNRVKVKIVKNKVAPPFKQTEFDMMYDKGILVSACLLDAGVMYGVIERTGTWYIYNGNRIGQGRDNARIFIEENPDIASEIEKKIKQIALPQLQEQQSGAKENKEKKLVKAASK